MRRAAFAASVLLLLGGCARPAGPVRVLGPAPALGPVTPAAFLAVAPGERSYQVTEGDDVQLLEVVCERSDQYGAAIVEQERPARSTFRILEADGSLATTAVIDRRDAALTRFDPPLVVAPQALESGQEHVAEAQMLVLDLDNPRRTKESGTATETLRYVGDYRIKVSGAEYVARHLQSTFDADLRMADAETTTTYWVVDDLGPIVIERNEVVRTLGVPIRSRAQTWVLTPAPR